MKYSQLNEQAQLKARKSYWFGNIGKLRSQGVSISDCHELCLDCDDDLLYKENGELICGL